MTNSIGYLGGYSKRLAFTFTCHSPTHVFDSLTQPLQIHMAVSDTNSGSHCQTPTAKKQMSLIPQLGYLDYLASV